MFERNESLRELIELVRKKYPEKAFLKPREAAEVLGCNIKTVYSCIERRYNPLPARNISNGIKNKAYIIPVTELCRWSMGKRWKEKQ